MKVTLAAFVILSSPSWALADEVYLKGGSSIHGVVVGQTGSQVTIEISAGTVTLPMSRVERVDKGPSALSEFRSRRSALSPSDVEGLLNLGFWARDQGLNTQAREIFQQVVAMNPGNAAAQVALGNVRMGDRFVTPDEAHRAQGLVSYQGSWVTPGEAQALMQEEAEARARADADRARRDAEAAQAEAAAAAAAQAAEMDSGMPFYPGYGYYPYGYLAHRYNRRPVVAPPIVVRPPTRPVPVPVPRAQPVTTARATTASAGLARRHR
jgi:hypothetical protein